MNLSRIATSVLIISFIALTIQARDISLTTVRDAAIPLGGMALGYALLGLAIFKRKRLYKEREFQRHKLPIGTIVAVTNPRASKGTYHIGDLAVIRDYLWTPNKQKMFYQVDWIDPSRDNINPAKRVRILHPAEIERHRSNTGLSNHPLRSSLPTSK